MISKSWNFLPDNLELQRALSSEFGISDILARLLINRVGSYEKSSFFLNPQLKDLHDPFLMSGMQTAALLIRKAVQQKKKFLIYGDYDVDGVTSTVLLLQFFDLLGAQADYYIPDRVTEGYSLTKKGLEAVLASGADMLITVDNGVSSVDQIRFLRDKGIDVIVTDHHEPPEVLPPANVIVDPKLKVCPYPFKNLAGVGVAFKLAWAVAQELSRPQKKVKPEFRAFLLDALTWVALGTVTDLVPLIDENRLLTKFGIAAIQSSNNPGLRALCEVACNAGVHLSAEDISFRIGPRINAAGRMGRIDKAVQLFRTTSPDEAHSLAVELDSLNRDRQTVERLIFLEAQNRARSLAHDVIVMGDRTWHPGVIGIVASKLTEEFGKPAILIALEGGLGKGSCRSLPGLDIHKALTHCSDLLEAFGGHALAGGFQIREAAVDPFRDKICGYASKSLKLKNWKPRLNVDAEIFLSAVTRKLLSEIDRLRPFGEGNPIPLFVASDLELAAPPQMVGRDQNHLVFHVRQGRSVIKAIAYGQGPTKEIVAQASRLAVVFTPKINFFNGRTSIELEVKDIKVDRN